MPEPLPRTARWAVFGVFALLVVVGVVRRAGDRPVLALVFGLAALVLGAVAFFAAAHLDAAGGDRGWCGDRRRVQRRAVQCRLVRPDRVWSPGRRSRHQCSSLPSSGLGRSSFCSVSCSSPKMTQVGSPGLAARSSPSSAARSDDGSATCSCNCERRRPAWRSARRPRSATASPARCTTSSRTASPCRCCTCPRARLALADDPDEAARALAEAERLGRESLDEVRHAVGCCMRPADRPHAPLPGSTDLRPGRAASARPAPTSRHVDGDLGTLPATVGLGRLPDRAGEPDQRRQARPGAPLTVIVAVTGRGAADGRQRRAARPRHGSRTDRHARARRRGRRACDAGPGGSGWLVHAELPLPVEHGAAT